jgi:uncharacterized protein (TIGR03437 family)
MVYFDGVQAPGVFNPASGSITVTPPSAPGGQVSTLTVFQSDSQNSMQLQYQNPATYTYPFAPGPQLQSISPNNVSTFPFTPYLTKVDITAANTQFVDGQVSVGFGTSDVTVTHVWVLSPTHAVADVLVAPGAATGSYEVSVISGMQTMTQPGGFQIQGANYSLPQIASVYNGETNTQAPVFAGDYAVVYGANLGASMSSVQVTVNSIPATVVFASPGQINFVAPGAAGTGPATLTVNNGGAASSVEIQLVNRPATVQGVSNSTGGQVDATHLAATGDTLSITTAGLDPTTAGTTGRVQVSVSGLAMPVVQVGPNQIQVVLTQSFGGSQVPLVVSVDGSPSAPFTISAR